MSDTTFVNQGYALTSRNMPQRGRTFRGVRAVGQERRVHYRKVRLDATRSSIFKK